MYTYANLHEYTYISMFKMGIQMTTNSIFEPVPCFFNFRGCIHRPNKGITNPEASTSGEDNPYVLTQEASSIYDELMEVPGQETLNRRPDLLESHSISRPKETNSAEPHIDTKTSINPSDSAVKNGDIHCINEGASTSNQPVYVNSGYELYITENDEYGTFKRP